MPVTAMKVVRKDAHEKTDKLFIYGFESPGLGELQIVANLTNVYEVGDVVAVAQVGTRLEEGEIQDRPVFGIPSAGMALGPVDVPVDTDLTAKFDADRPSRRWRVTLEVEVDGYYAGDAEKAARKALKGGAGSRIAANPVQE